MRSRPWTRLAASKPAQRAKDPLSYPPRTRSSALTTKRWWLYGGLSLLGMRYVQQQYDSYRQECTHLLHDVPLSVLVLKILPLRLGSWIWARVANLPIPRPLREPIFSAYAKVAGIHLAEARASSLKAYPTMNAFFTRKLKEGARVVHTEDVDLVCPSDGLILGCGQLAPLADYIFKDSNRVELDVLENIIVRHAKGFRFPLAQFLGEYLVSTETGLPYLILDATRASTQAHVTNALEHSHVHRQSSHNKPPVSPHPREDHQELVSFLHPVPKRLYYCAIYLAPKDCHRFHSPTDWCIHSIRHIYGELFPVQPRILSWIPSLHVLNERRPLIGTWKHGRFSMTPVGSTAVGRIKIVGDVELSGFRPARTVMPWTATLTMDAVKPMQMHTGEEIGFFELGSTIILIFEAPENFKFLVHDGQSIQMGLPLGKIV